MSEFLSQPDLHALVLKQDAPVSSMGRKSLGIGGGIYALFGEDEALLYIGKSLHIHNRVIQHFHAATRSERKKFKYWSAVDVPTDLMDMVEIAHIWALEPPENALPRHSHPQHDALVKLIQEEWKPV